MVSDSSRIVKEASCAVSLSAVPDFMPFLPLAFRVRLPLPHSTTCAPSLPLITAFSASVLSGYSVSLFWAASVSVLVVPSAATIVTTLDFPQVMGAVELLVRQRSDKISVTPAVPFLTLTEPSAQLPVSK